MSNGESKLGQLLIVLLLVIGYSIMITSTSTTSRSRSDPLPSLTRVAYRGQALAKLRLLIFGFFLLLRVACLLLRARPGGTAGEHNNNRRNQKHGGCQLFHRTIRVIKLMGAGNFGDVIR